MVTALRWAFVAAVFASCCDHGHLLEVKPLGARICDDAVPQDNMQFYNLTIMRVDNYYRASLIVVMPRAVETISKASVKLVQCPTNKGCKHFYTMRFSTGVCSLLSDRHTFWAPLFAGAQPPFHCPIQKRAYYFHNATVEATRFANLFSAVSPGVERAAIWLARLDAFDEHAKQFACINMKIAHA